LKTYANTALHFDARLLAKFLRKVAEGRRIKRIEGIVDKVINDKNNNISQLLLMDGSKVDVDFIFDCSGFARLLIGKHFKTEWISYKQSLPLDSAMPFFIEHNNEVAPQTDAIAMKYGWVWKIPVQGRYGCGYVFDSSYISEDEAKQELEVYFGHKIESPKTFKFEAGAYKNALVNNCMAVGLSQGFIEPLEATSIWINNINLTSFLKSDGINTMNPQRQERFNHECNERNNAVKSFIYLHYLTKRNDSDFWKNFRTKNVMPEDLRVFLDDFLESPFMQETSALWGSESFFAIMSGLGLFDTKKFETIVNRYGLKYDKSKEILVNKLEEIAAQCLPHQRFINEALKLE
jgi:tryptophan halogenase